MNPILKDILDADKECSVEIELFGSKVRIMKVASVNARSSVILRNWFVEQAANENFPPEWKSEPCPDYSEFISTEDGKYKGSNLEQYGIPEPKNKWEYEAMILNSSYVDAFYCIDFIHEYDAKKNGYVKSKFPPEERLRFVTRIMAHPNEMAKLQKAVVEVNSLFPTISSVTSTSEDSAPTIEENRQVELQISSESGSK